MKGQMNRLIRIMKEQKSRSASEVATERPLFFDTFTSKLCKLWT